MTQPRLSVALRSLRDIHGVLGSFVWQPDGALIASDVPPSCALDTMTEVVARLQRLCEAFAGAGDQFESTTLAFGNYKLHVCGVEWASIAIVVADHVNMSALQLALKLSLRELARLQTSEHESAASNADTGAATRSYRGRPIAG
jgi:predicted regulator of Ras-like GTPase activity (Roadblock/LC7/MglB family)